MRILLSAIACHPHRGSEARFGWQAVRALSRKHELWVLAHVTDREAIEAARGELPGRVHFHYHGRTPQYSGNRALARLQGWREYVRWNRQSLPIARQLHEECRFDAAHHVTLSSWRVASPLWKLGIPFIWGPLGGGESFPWKLFPLLSLRSRLFEILRCFSDLIGLASRHVRACARHSSVLLAANPETARLLSRLSQNLRPVHQLCPLIFDDADRTRFSGGPGKDWRASLEIFAGGDLEGRKGLALAIRALAEFKAGGGRFRFQISGHGAEEAHLKSLVAALGLANEVIFTGYLHGKDYPAVLRRAHVYLMPSLRDNSPVTLMEAMLAGCVPIVAGCGGPALIVQADWGCRIAPDRSAGMIRAITAAIRKIDSDRAASSLSGERARQHVESACSPENYLETMSRFYRKAAGIVELPA